MTDLETLYRAIIECPGDDTPRLLLADELADSSDESDRARAEFVRVQCRLARHDAAVSSRGTSMKDIPPVHPDFLIRSKYAELRRRERELWNFDDPNEPSVFRSYQKLFGPIGSSSFPLGFGIVRGNPPWAIVSRGFISSLTCSWQDWLAHADKMVWWPGATDDCPNCEGAGEFTRDNSDPPYGPCPNCGGKLWTGPYYEPDDHGWDKGTGRIPRPMPPTCQPIEVVQLTTHPVLTWEGPNGFLTPGGLTFTRLKCSACGDWVRSPWSACPACHGRPQNRWTCETWPRVVFEMPGT